MAIIPVRGKDVEVEGVPVLLGGSPLIGYTIDAALNSPVVRRTVVTTDSPAVRELAVSLGAEAPFLRPAELADSGVSLDQVLQHCLEWLERNASPALNRCLTRPERDHAVIDNVGAIGGVGRRSVHGRCRPV